MRRQLPSRSAASDGYVTAPAAAPGRPGPRRPRSSRAAGPWRSRGASRVASPAILRPRGRGGVRPRSFRGVLAAPASLKRQGRTQRRSPRPGGVPRPERDAGLIEGATRGSRPPPVNRSTLRPHRRGGRPGPVAAAGSAASDSALRARPPAAGPWAAQGSAAIGARPGASTLRPRAAPSTLRGGRPSGARPGSLDGLRRRSPWRAPPLRAHAGAGGPARQGLPNAPVVGPRPDLHAVVNHAVNGLGPSPPPRRRARPAPAAHPPSPLRPKSVRPPGTPGPATAIPSAAPRRSPAPLRPGSHRPPARIGRACPPHALQVMRHSSATRSRSVRATQAHGSPSATSIGRLDAS